MLATLGTFLPDQLSASRSFILRSMIFIYAATTGASGQASRPPINSFSMSTASTTSVTHFPGAPDRYCWSHQCSVLISWRMGPAVCRLRYVLATFISIILFLAVVDHFNEVGDFPKVHADLKNRMISG